MYKILVVEDDVLDRKKLLTATNYSKLDCFIMAVAENGQEGMEKIQALKPDIVMCDIHMPLLDGIEMLEKTKEYEYGSIIISESESFFTAQKALQAGASDYLLKPIDQKQLEKALHRAIDKRKLRLYYERLAQEKIRIENRCQPIEFSTRDFLVEEMIHYIHDHYMHKIILKDVSWELNYSETLLNRRFRKATSMTFCDYLNCYRITKAIEMMKEGSHYIYDIAMLCGFSEYKYFAVVFKKYTGCSLKEYRKQIEG